MTTSINDVSILIIDGMPIQHLPGAYDCHIERLLEERGPLFISSPPYDGVRVSSFDEVACWCGVHAGVYQDDCGFLDASGQVVDWLVLADPFYRYELEPDVAARVEQYCRDNNIALG